MAKTSTLAVVVSLVAGVAGLALQHLAYAASGHIPSLNARVTSLRFFETPYTMVPREKREYAHRFGKGDVRFIGWELNLEHPAAGRRVNFPVEQVWYRADGSILARQTQQTFLEPGWISSYHNHSWGWSTVGKWPAGTYRVDLYIDGQQVASGSFKIDAAPNDAIAANKAGNRFFHTGQYSDAIAYFTQAIRLYPEYVVAYSNRCAAYGALGKHEQAIADCTKALRIEPTLAEAYGNRGMVYHQKGQGAQAIADYTHAIALHPNYARAYAHRGHVYYDTGEHAKALADWHKAQALGYTFNPVTETRFAELRQAAQAGKQPAEASKPAPQASKPAPQASTQPPQTRPQPPPKVTTEDLADDIEQYDSLDRRISKLAYDRIYAALLTRSRAGNERCTPLRMSCRLHWRHVRCRSRRSRSTMR